MTRLGRDSTTASDIPLAGTDVAIGYINGTYQWSQADWDLFPHVAHATIDVSGKNPTADILDIETGDATVGQAPSWVRSHNKANPAYPAILYCDRSTLTPLFNALNASSLIVARDFRLFVATLDGTKTLTDMTGVWAIQYAGETQTGGHYDESIVYDDKWNVVAPPPTPGEHAAAPAPPGLWFDGTFTGRGLDGRLWRTDYDSHTGLWTPPVREP
jgi:hypothetical protein